MEIGEIYKQKQRVCVGVRNVEKWAGFVLDCWRTFFAVFSVLYPWIPSCVVCCVLCVVCWLCGAGSWVGRGILEGLDI